MNWIDAQAHAIEAAPAVIRLGSSIWLYPLVNVAHVLGVALLVGAIVVLDLRLVGLWRFAPLPAMAPPATIMAVIGFVIAASSGAALFTVQAVSYLHNPMFWLKLAFILVAAVNLVALRRAADWNRARYGLWSRRVALAGVVSIACWVGALTAGRLIAYW